MTSLPAPAITVLLPKALCMVAAVYFVFRSS